MAIIAEADVANFLQIEVLAIYIETIFGLLKFVVAKIWSLLPTINIGCKWYSVEMLISVMWQKHFEVWCRMS